MKFQDSGFHSLKAAVKAQTQTSTCSGTLLKQYAHLTGTKLSHNMRLICSFYVLLYKKHAEATTIRQKKEICVFPVPTYPNFSQRP